MKQFVKTHLVLIYVQPNDNDNSIWNEDSFVQKISIFKNYFI